jgi:hypothetical protein
MNVYQTTERKMIIFVVTAVRNVFHGLKGRPRRRWKDNIIQNMKVSWSHAVVG